jgi:tetratricopeptide (TPR) repeat protein
MAVRRDPDVTIETVGSKYWLDRELAVPFDTVLSIIEEHEPERTRCSIYLAYAEYFCITSRRPQVRLTITERAVGLARRLGDIVMLGKTLVARSMALLMAGRRSEAFLAVREALELSEASGNLGLLTDVLATLIQVHVHRGEFDQGNLYNDRALEVAEAVGNSNAAAWAWGRRAWMAKYTGGWTSAQANLARALLLAPERAHDPWVNCLHGELCLVMGDWSDARAYLDLAVDQATRFGYMPALVCAQVFQAELDLLEGRPEVALLRVHAAMELDQGEYAPLLLTWAALGNLQLGDVDKAEAASQQAVSGAIEADDQLALPDTLRVQALVAIERRQWLEAERILDGGLALTRRIGFQNAEARLLHTHGLLYARKGEIGAAQRHLDSALAIFQRLGAVKDMERSAQDLKALRLSDTLAPRPD